MLEYKRNGRNFFMKEKSKQSERVDKGYWILMPTEPELGITAPCKLW